MVEKKVLKQGSETVVMSIDMLDELSAVMTVPMAVKMAVLKVVRLVEVMDDETAYKRVV